MIRHVAAAAVCLCLIPSWLCAQTTSLTVGVASADVHKFASIGSPVIGKAPRGTVLEVRRELGSWVTVAWPAAEDGIAYMHVITGSISRGPAVDANGRAVGTSPPPAPVARVESPLESQPPAPVRRQAPASTVFVTPATHVVGLGGMGGSTTGLGASVRAWRRNRIGVQFNLSRSAIESSLAPGRLTSTQIEPSVLFALPNRVGDYVWVRPYIGSGIGLRRQSLNSGIPGTVDSPARTGFGVQAFGGGELTFSAAPRFALSTDLSYHWSRMPVPGFEVGGLGVSVSGHWYVK